MAVARRIDQIDDRLNRIHQRARSSFPAGYQPAAPYIGANVPTVDVGPAFDHFANHLQHACDEVYHYYRHNRRALTAADTRFLARHPPMEGLRHNRSTLRVCSAEVSSPVKHGQPVEDEPDDQDSQSQTETWYQLQETALPQTYASTTDGMALDLEPGEYDVTLTYVDTQNRPLSQSTQRVQLRHGQALELETI
eukprot:m.81831 g.81831  ORF g.81831 m.81831 type:complete len:194 (-) comp14583_c0_seq1:1581-2162(-)